MDKRTLLDAAASSAEERLLLGRVWDQYDRCRLKGLPTATAFLSPQEQSAARRLLTALGAEEGFLFHGGYEGAERCRLCFLPEWAWEAEEGLVRAIRCTWYAGSSVNHRDLLGSLMGMGITRESVGDILVGEESADVLVTGAVADHLLTAWDSAGRVHLRTAEVPLDHLHIPQAKTKTIRDTVPQLRLDSIVSSGFSLSGGRAAEAIAAGKVQLNWTTCTKSAAEVAQGDTISLRGLGKCQVEEVGNQTKKGRIFVSIKRYL